MSLTAFALKMQYGDLWEMEPRALSSLMHTPPMAYSERPAKSRRQFQRLERSAIIPITGTLVPRGGGFLDELLGLTGLDAIGRSFDEAMRDDYVDRIVLVIDSPGGSVFGVEELARKILAGRDQKRIVAMADGYAASAAYHIGAAASEFVVSPSSLTGGICVYRAHEDVSRHLDKTGYKVTLISAGKHKVEGNPYEPLSRTARAAIQSEVNEYYRKFVEVVAAGRQVTPAQVRSGFGRGRVVGSREAVAQGMADRVATLGTVLADSVSRPIRRQRPTVAKQSRVDELRDRLRRRLN